MSRSTVASIAALTGFAIFGVSFMASSVAMETATPMILLGIRFFTAFVAMNLVVLVGRIPLRFRGKPMGKLLLLGFLQSVVYYTCENYGIAMTSTSFSGIMLGTIPVFGLLLGWLIQREKISRLQCVCSAISILGVALTSTGGGDTASSPLGILLLLTAAASSAWFNILSQETSRIFSPMERTYIMFAIGGTVFPLMMLFQNRGDLSVLLLPLTTPSFWLATLFLALCSSIGGFLLINYANGHLPASRVSLFTNFGTVIAVLLGIFVMGDSFSFSQIAGILLIIASVVTISLSPVKP